MHINKKYSWSLIIYGNKLHTDIMNELLIGAFKENSSEHKLLYGSFPAWV